LRHLSLILTFLTITSGLPLILLSSAIVVIFVQVEHQFSICQAIWSAVFARALIASKQR